MRALAVSRGRVSVSLLNQVAALFRNGEQGAWYDPSDLTTLYQDAAGTTPVTAVEQPVGLMLDKSKGLTLGSELVTNGDFASDTWWSKGSGCTISGGVGVATTAGNQSGWYRLSLLTIGKYYEITFTVVSCSSGGFAISFFNTTKSATYSTAGTYTVRLLSDATSFGIMTIGVSTTGTIDNVSIKEVTGNHAYQSTSANRPTLSARYNLLTKTEQFDDAAWTKGANASITPNSVTAPDGTQTADTYTSSGTTDSVYTTVSGQATGSYNALMRFKQGTGRWIRWTTYDGSNGVRAWIDTQTGAAGATGTLGTGASVTSFACAMAADGWITASLVATLPGTTKYFQINSADSNSGFGSANGTTYLWGADLRVANDGVGLPAYQRVNTASDYTATGFAQYESFNGSNSSVVSATGGGGTAGFFYCSAIYVGGGAGAARTLFSDAGTNTGYIVRLNASNQLELAAGNGTAYTTIATTATLPVGERHVITAWDDGVNLNVQIDNGTVAQAARPTVSAGTAGFTIGCNNGAASGYFTGRMYHDVYRQTAPSAAQITSTKNYVATKASMTL